MARVKDSSLTVGGTPLHVVHTRPTGKAIGAALLLHGFNSDHQEFGPLPEALARHGVHAFAWDQRGFGQSGGERGLVTLGAVADEVDAVLAACRGELGDVPVAAVGHSLGAAFVCGLFARGPSPFRAVVLAHPPRRLLEETSWPAAMAYHVLGRFNEARHRRGHPNLTIKNPVREKDLFISPAAVARAQASPFLLRRANVGTYRLAHEMDAAAWAAHVDVPTLGITSPNDRVVRPRHSERVLGSVAGPLERMEHEAGHSLFLDTGGEERADRVAAWVAARTGAA